MVSIYVKPDDYPNLVLSIRHPLLAAFGHGYFRADIRITFFQTPTKTQTLVAGAEGNNDKYHTYRYFFKKPPLNSNINPLMSIYGPYNMVHIKMYIPLIKKIKK